MNIRESILKSVVAVGTTMLLLGAVPGVAQAGLLGQNATCDMQPGSIWICDPVANSVVDSGFEFQLLLNGGVFFEVDIDDTSILLTLVNEGGLGMGAGEVLTLAGFSGILGAVLDFSDSIEFDNSDVSFTGSSVTLVLNGSNWSPGNAARVLVTARNVPEPGSLALLGFALVGLCFARRRTRQ